MKDLIITKNYPGLIDEGWALKLVGKLEVEGSLTVRLDGKWLWVTGGIEAGGGRKGE